jgi:hypothetical protein
VTFSPCQAAYIATIIQCFGLAELQKTPMLPSGAVYSKDDIPSDPSYVTRKKNSWYHEAAKAIAGSLMHAAVATRPDIDSPYLISVPRESVGAPSEIKRIFCYISGTKDLELTFSGDATTCTAAQTPTVLLACSRTSSPCLGTHFLLN